jgi:hypothetical protein
VSWASISSMPTPQRFHMHRMTQQMIAGATTALLIVLIFLGLQVISSLMGQAWLSGQALSFTLIVIFLPSMPTPQRFHMHRMTQQMIAGATTAIGCWLSSTMA